MLAGLRLWRSLLIGVAIALVLSVSVLGILFGPTFHEGPHSSSTVSMLLRIVGFSGTEVLEQIRESSGLSQGSDVISAGLLQTSLEHLLEKALVRVVLGLAVVVLVGGMAIAMLLRGWGRSRSIHRLKLGLFAALLTTTVIILRHIGIAETGMIARFSGGDEVELFAAQAEVIEQVKAPLIWIEASDSSLVKALLLSQWLSPRTDFLVFEQAQWLNHLKRFGPRYSEHFLMADSEDLPGPSQSLDGIELASIKGLEEVGLWRLQGPLVSTAGAHSTCVTLLPGLSLVSSLRFSVGDSIMEP